MQNKAATQHAHTGAQKAEPVQLADPEVLNSDSRYTRQCATVTHTNSTAEGYLTQA